MFSWSLIRTHLYDDFEEIVINFILQLFFCLVPVSDN